MEPVGRTQLVEISVHGHIPHSHRGPGASGQAAYHQNCPGMLHGDDDFKCRLYLNGFHLQVEPVGRTQLVEMPVHGHIPHSHRGPGPPGQAAYHQNCPGMLHGDDDFKCRLYLNGFHLQVEPVGWTQLVEIPVHGHIPHSHRGPGPPGQAAYHQNCPGMLHGDDDFKCRLYLSGFHLQVEPVGRTQLVENTCPWSYFTLTQRTWAPGTSSLSSRLPRDAARR